MKFREIPGKLIDNIIPDIKDNFPSISKLRSWKISSENLNSDALEKIKNQFLSREQHAELLVGLQSLPSQEELFEYLWLVGEKQKGSLHPHVFLVERKEQGFNLFFVDPEHNVSSQNLFRPKISNLVTMRILPQYKDSEIAIIRFSVIGLTPDQLKLRQQFVATQELLHQGHLSMLEKHEGNILFQAVIRGDHAQIQARYTNDQKAKDFLEGGKGSRALRGKIEANTAIINRFIRFLQEGKLKKSKRFSVSQ